MKRRNKQAILGGLGTIAVTVVAGVLLNFFSAESFTEFFNNIISPPTPPDTEIISAVDARGTSVPNNGTTYSSSIKFMFNGTDNDRVTGFQCSLNGEEWTECTSPKTYNLSTGHHTYNFKARSIDTAGDSDPTPDTYDIIKSPLSEVSGIVEQNEVPYGPVIVVAEKNDKPDNKFNYTTREEGIFFLKGVPVGIYAVDVLHISGNILKCTEREAKEGSQNNWEISVTELEQNKSVIPTHKKCVTKVEPVKSETSYQVTLNQTAIPIPPEKRTAGAESNIAEIKIQINATLETLKQIDRVTYKLDPTFKSPIVTQLSSPDNGFALSFTAWGKFDLEAIVYFKDGQSTILSLPSDKWRV